MEPYWSVANAAASINALAAGDRTANHLRRGRTKALFVHQEFWMPFYEYVKHLEKVGTINGITDRIKVQGIDDDDDDKYYVAESVHDENEAFERTRSFVRRLYQTNQLTLG